MTQARFAQKQGRLQGDLNPASKRCLALVIAADDAEAIARIRMETATRKSTLRALYGGAAEEQSEEGEGFDSFEEWQREFRGMTSKFEAQGE